MNRNAIVKEVEDSMALVCPVDCGECDTCQAKHACFSLSGKKREEKAFWLENSIGAVPGDIVRIELSPSASLSIITVTFLGPVLLLFAGYLLMMSGSDAERALGAGAGLCLGIVIALVVNRKLDSRKNFNMQIVKILEKDGSGGAEAGSRNHDHGRTGVLE
jgi:positive regulator of sigma E activity